MKNKLQSSVISIIVALIVSLTLHPTPVLSAYNGEQDTTHFDVVNNSESDAVVVLWDNDVNHLFWGKVTVISGNKATIDVDANHEYSYYINVCGFYTYGTIQIDNTYKELDLLPCGSAYPEEWRYDKPHQVVLDSPHDLKPVKWEFLNDSNSYANIYFVGSKYGYTVNLEPSLQDATERKADRSARVVTQYVGYDNYEITVEVCGMEFQLPQKAYEKRSVYIPDCATINVGGIDYLDPKYIEAKPSTHGKLTIFSALPFDTTLRLLDARDNTPLYAFYIHPNETLNIDVPMWRYDVEYYGCAPNDWYKNIISLRVRAKNKRVKLICNWNDREKQKRPQ